MVAKHLRIVEGAHFNTSIRREAMRGDVKNASRVFSNIYYTLRRFPNHTPALFHLAMFDHLVATRGKLIYERVRQEHVFAPVRCYFETAAAVFPDDPNVPNTLGMYLTRINKHNDAIKAFEQAVKLAPESASAHYNLGLGLYAAKKYTESAKAAREAYKRGYKRTELKARLKRNGHW